MLRLQDWVQVYIHQPVSLTSDTNHSHNRRRRTLQNDFRPPPLSAVRIPEEEETVGQVVRDGEKEVLWSAVRSQRGDKYGSAVWDENEQ